MHPRCGQTALNAITSFGFPEGCHAIGGYVRLDTSTALAFLGQFGSL